MITIDFSQKTPIYKQLVEQLTRMIKSGELKPGDKLPTEIQLAEMLSMSKNTVREAIKILVAYGAIEIRRPEGNGVN